MVTEKEYVLNKTWHLLSGTDTHLGVKEMVLTLAHKEEPLLKISTFKVGKER